MLYSRSLFNDEVGHVTLKCGCSIATSRSLASKGSMRERWKPTPLNKTSTAHPVSFETAKQIIAKLLNQISRPSGHIWLTSPPDPALAIGLSLTRHPVIDHALLQVRTSKSRGATFSISH